MKIKEASKLMGISENLLRIIIRERKLPEDVAFCIKNKNKYYYYINDNRFIDYLKKSC